MSADATLGFYVDDPWDHFVPKSNGIAILDQGFQFTGTNTSAGTRKDITIVGPSSTGFRNYDITWPANIPTTGQILAISSSTYSSVDDLQTVSLEWGTDINLFTEDTAGSAVIDHNIYGGTGAGGSITTATENFFAGVNAGANISSGSSNIAVGNTALTTATTQSDNIAIGTGALTVAANTNARNVAIGSGALGTLTGAAGVSANNVAVGYNSVNTTTDTSLNQSIYIGAETKASGATADNEVVIGYGATGKGNNTVLLGNSSVTDVYIGQSNSTNLVLTGNSFTTKIRGSSVASENAEWILPPTLPSSGQVLGATVAGSIATLGWKSASTTADPMIYLASTNTGDTYDIGFYGKYVNAGTKYTGFIRDATDGTFKLFAGLPTAPTATSVGDVSAYYANMNCNAITLTSITDGTATLTGGALTGATQITVDQLDLNGSNITYSGATGTNLITVPDNLASALLVTDGTQNYIQLVSTTGLDEVQLLQNTNVTGTLSCDTSFTIDAVSVTASNLTSLLAMITAGVQNLTASEVTQLSNIDLVTISNTQWGYLGAMNQGVSTADSVSFTSITDGTATLTGGALTGATQITVDQLDLNGSNITYSGTTGTNLITVPDNLASALLVTNGVQNYIQVVSSIGLDEVQLLQNTSVTGTLSCDTSFTIDAVSVTASNLTSLLAMITAGVQNLTASEVTQLSNIDLVTISNTQWGYLGAMNQGVSTADSVSFISITDGTATLTGGALTGATQITVDQLDLNGSNITYSGATGTNLITVPDNLASALLVTDGTQNYIQLVSTTGLDEVQLLQNTNVTGTLSCDTSFTIDAVSITASNLTSLLAMITAGVQNLTASEVTQLSNIDLVTISNTQWGYLGAMNQGVSTADSVSFTSITDGTATLTGGALTGATQITVDQLDLNGSNITYSGATGTNLITVPDNLASALLVTNGVQNYIQVVTSIGSDEVQLLQNTNVTGTLSCDTLFTIDAVSITASNLTSLLAMITAGVQNLTASEVTQLSNIDLVTISNTQWGYLGAMNQGVSTADSVSFTSITDGTATLTGGALTGATQITVDQLDLNGSNITYSGATGTNLITVPDNLASAFLITDGTQNYIQLVSTTGLDEVQLLQNTNVIGTLTAYTLFFGGTALNYSPGATGIGLSGTSATYTDTTTLASGTAALMAVHALAQPTLAAANVSVTTTNAATLYVANAPVAGTNMTLTNAYALYVAAGNTYLSGNVGIGTAGPNAKLSISASVGVPSSYANYGIILYDVSATESYGFGVEGGYLWANAQGGHRWYSSDVLKMSLESTGTLLLQSSAVSNRAQIVPGASSELMVRNTATTTANLHLAAGSTSGIIYSYNGGYQPLYLGVAANVILCDTTGNVGIGTTGPDAKLDVLYTSGPQLRLTYTDNTVYTTFETNSSGGLSITPSGNFTNIYGDGQLLSIIGSTHCYFALFPDGSGAGRKCYIGYGGATSQTLSIVNEYTGVNSDMVLETEDVIYLKTASTNRIVIDASGYVGIGMTPSSTYNAKLQVSDSATFGNSGIRGAGFPSFDWNSYWTGAAWQFLASGYAGILELNTGTGAISLLQSTASGTAGAGITWNTNVVFTPSGYVGIGKTPGYQLELSTDSAGKPTTNTWTITSDKRIKKNVADVDGKDALARLRQMRIRSFAYTTEYARSHHIEEGKRFFGVIADEVQTCMPSTVRTVPNMQFEYTLEPKKRKPKVLGPYSVLKTNKKGERKVITKLTNALTFDSNDVTLFTVSAVQVLADKVDALETQLAEKDARIDALETQLATVLARLDAIV